MKRACSCACCKQNKIILTAISATLHEMDERQQREAHHTSRRLDVILKELREHKKPKPRKMELQFGTPEDTANVVSNSPIRRFSDMADPGRETDKQTIPCAAIETDADGNPVALNAANVVWAIDDPSLAELTQNADGSASFKALKVGGPTNISCTDNGVNPPLVGTNTLEVVASTKTATSMALVFGDPQAATA